MKTFFLPLIISPLLWLGSLSPIQAQPLFGYQTIGVHTVYVSASWNGKPNLGLGYSFRDTRTGAGFTDYSAEWRFPLDEVFRTDNHQLIVGVYGPYKLRRRPFTGLGAHLRIQKQSQDGVARTRYSLAFTALPTYTYANPTNNGPFGTIGARLTYVIALAEQRKVGASSRSVVGFPAHGVEAGAHLDLHLERTMSLGVNGFATRNWGIKDKALPEAETNWSTQGDFYWGSTYYLERW